MKMPVHTTSHAQVLQRTVWADLPIVEDFPDVRNMDKRNMKLSERIYKVNTEDDIFYNDAKPVLNSLRIMGVLPLQRSRKGMEFHLLSPLMIYSAFVYIGMLFVLWMVHGHELQSSQYDDSILALYHMVLLLLVLVVPFTNWWDAPRIAGLLSMWPDFQVEFYKVTGQILTLSMKRRSWILAMSVPIGSIAIELCYQLLDISVNILQLISDIYLLILRIFLAVIWHLHCHALAQVADKILYNLCQKMKTTSNTIAEYRVLWFDLAKLTKETGSSMCYTYGFYILYMFMKLTLNMYWTLNAVLFVPNKPFVVIYIIISIVNDIVIMFIFCDNAQLVQRKVTNAFKETLMEYKMMISNHIVTEEVDMFLQTIKTISPVLNLGDFVVVNRSLLISLGSVMVTYLVVLLQFKMSNLSIGDSNCTSVNMTNITSNTNSQQ